MRTSAPQPRFPCYVCGRIRAVSRLVERPNGYMCHPCFYKLTAENAPDAIPKRHVTVATNRKRDRGRSKGLTAEGWDELFTKQHGLCAICLGKPADPLKLLIDHNHDTGEVRGLLCGSCNTGIGLLQDDPDLLDRARQYLTERGHYARRGERR